MFILHCQLVTKAAFLIFSFLCTKVTKTGIKNEFEIKKHINKLIKAKNTTTLKLNWKQKMLKYNIQNMNNKSNGNKG